MNINIKVVNEMLKNVDSDHEVLLSNIIAKANAIDDELFNNELSVLYDLIENLNINTISVEEKHIDQYFTNDYGSYNTVFVVVHIQDNNRNIILEKALFWSNYKSPYTRYKLYDNCTHYTMLYQVLVDMISEYRKGINNLKINTVIYDKPVLNKSLYSGDCINTYIKSLNELFASNTIYECNNFKYNSKYFEADLPSTVFSNKPDSLLFYNSNKFMLYNRILSEKTVSFLLNNKNLAFLYDVIKNKLEHDLDELDSSDSDIDSNEHENSMILLRSYVHHLGTPLHISTHVNTPVTIYETKYHKYGKDDDNHNVFGLLDTNTRLYFTAFTKNVALEYINDYCNVEYIEDDDYLNINKLLELFTEHYLLPLFTICRDDKTGQHVIKYATCNNLEAPIRDLFDLYSDYDCVNYTIIRGYLERIVSIRESTYHEIVDNKHPGYNMFPVMVDGRMKYYTYKEFYDYLYDKFIGGDNK